MRRPVSAYVCEAGRWPQESGRGGRYAHSLSWAHPDSQVQADQLTAWKLQSSE